MFAEVEREGLLLMTSEPKIKKIARTIETIPEVNVDEMIKRFGVNPPGVYLMVGDARGVDGDTSAFNVDAVFAVVVRNAKTEKEARSGDGIAVGAYQFAGLVASRVHKASTDNADWTVDAIHFLDLAEIRSAGLVVVTIESKALTSLPANMTDEEYAQLADFLAVRASYDIPPFASADEHAKWVADPQDLSQSTPKLQDSFNPREP